MSSVKMTIKGLYYLTLFFCDFIISDKTLGDNLLVVVPIVYNASHNISTVFTLIIFFIYLIYLRTLKGTYNTCTLTLEEKNK